MFAKNVFNLHDEDESHKTSKCPQAGPRYKAEKGYE